MGLFSIDATAKLQEIDSTMFTKPVEGIIQLTRSLRVRRGSKEVIRVMGDLRVRHRIKETIQISSLKVRRKIKEIIQTKINLK